MKPLCSEAGACWESRHEFCRIGGQTCGSRQRCNLAPGLLTSVQASHARETKHLAAAERAVKGDTE